VVTVLLQSSHDLADRLGELVPGVDAVPVPLAGPVDPGIEGEILLTVPVPLDNLGDLLDRGVRWVHLGSTGVDRFPVELVGDRTLTCARGSTAVPIAEWCLAVMLAFEKDLPGAWVTEAPARWNFPADGTLGTLDGRTLGLVGLGTINLAVAQRALAFGMRVVGLRRTAAPAPMPGIELVGSISELMATSDHVVVAAPATPATHHLVDAAALAAAKPGLHLVNVARGSLVDQDALHTALDAGTIARASLDVCDPEPLPAGHWLYDHPSVRLSPHISWSSPEGLTLVLDTFVANLRRYVAGEPLEGIVDRVAGY
jgi:phosphoglycerate dehydrogenase-like enzyme